MAESQSSGSDTEDWEETGLESSPCLCLFCISKFDGGSSAVLDHCSQEHGFDLFKFAQKLGWFASIYMAILCYYASILT